MKTTQRTFLFKIVVFTAVFFFPFAHGQEPKVYTPEAEKALMQAQKIKDGEGINRITAYHILAYKKDGVFARLSPSNATLLHLAAQAGSTELVSALLQAGVPVESQTEDLQSPLHWAALGGSVEAAESLLKANANPDAMDNNKRTPLWLAASKGNTVLCLILLKYGANPNIKGFDPERSYAYTPLKIAQMKKYRGTAALIQSMGGK